MSNSTDQTSHEKDHPHHHLVVTYFMNEEVEQTHVHQLKAEIMLAQAGFEPPSQYRLIREASEKKERHEYALTDEVELHEGDRFEVLHRGPTQTS